VRARSCTGKVDAEPRQPLFPFRTAGAVRGRLPYERALAGGAALAVCTYPRPHALEVWVLCHPKPASTSHYRCRARGRPYFTFFSDGCLYFFFLPFPSRRYLPKQHASPLSRCTPTWVNSKASWGQAFWDFNVLQPTTGRDTPQPRCECDSPTLTYQVCCICLAAGSSAKIPASSPSHPRTAGITPGQLGSQKLHCRVETCPVRDWWGILVGQSLRIKPPIHSFIR
jgi:hypothetical protein